MTPCMKRSTALAAVAALLVFAGAARAAIITDGSLQLDIASDGQFRIITLNGTGIDTSVSVQQYYLMGGVTFTGGTPVTAAGPTATYSTVAGLFNVYVTSSILGPLASNPATTNVLEQVLTFTNATANPVTLAASSFMDQDLKNTSTGDTVAYDAAKEAVWAVDALQLLAAIVETDIDGGTFGWDVDTLSLCDRYFPLGGGVGPTGPSNTAMAIGYSVGQVPSGGTATYTFRYLFSTDLGAVPPEFTFVPLPGTFALLGTLTGMAGLVRRFRRRRAA